VSALETATAPWATYRPWYHLTAATGAYDLPVLTSGMTCALCLSLICKTHSIPT